MVFLEGTRMRNRICIWERYRVADERYLSVDREQFFLPISWLSVFILPRPCDTRRSIPSFLILSSSPLPLFNRIVASFAPEF